MTGNEYQNLAMRTNDGKNTERLKRPIDLLERGDKPDCFNAVVNDLGGVFNACLGLSGEVGELNDMIKKWIFHEKPLDEEHAKKEMGDVMWYVAMMCHSFGWDLDEIMQMNVDKLKARYPRGGCMMAKNKQYPICGLGEKLKELCYKNNVPAYKLGEIAGGYERKTVYGWLHGDTVINSLALAKICAYFHVSADWLLGLEKVGV